MGGAIRSSSRKSSFHAALLNFGAVWSICSVPLYHVEGHVAASWRAIQAGRLNAISNIIDSFFVNTQILICDSPVPCRRILDPTGLGSYNQMYVREFFLCINFKTIVSYNLAINYLLAIVP